MCRWRWCGNTSSCKACTVCREDCQQIKLWQRFMYWHFTRVRYVINYHSFSYIISLFDSATCLSYIPSSCYNNWQLCPSSWSPAVTGASVPRVQQYFPKFWSLFMIARSYWSQCPTRPVVLPKILVPLHDRPQLLEPVSYASSSTSQNFGPSSWSPAVTGASVLRVQQYFPKFWSLFMIARSYWSQCPTRPAVLPKILVPLHDRPQLLEPVSYAPSSTSQNFGPSSWSPAVTGASVLRTQQYFPKFWCSHHIGVRISLESENL
jgi:hypothetical protein